VGGGTRCRGGRLAAKCPGGESAGSGPGESAGHGCGAWVAWLARVRHFGGGGHWASAVGHLGDWDSGIVDVVMAHLLG
jgi:hypothetical protein